MSNSSPTHFQWYRGYNQIEMNDQSNALVTLQKEEEVSIISLNDEGSFNSLSENLLKELFDVLRESDQDDTTKVFQLPVLDDLLCFDVAFSISNVTGTQREFKKV